jgi:hypothetical protein
VIYGREDYWFSWIFADVSEESAAILFRIEE